MTLAWVCTLSMAVSILLTPPTTMAARTAVTPPRRNNVAAIPGAAAGGDATQVHGALRSEGRTTSHRVHAAPWKPATARGKGSSQSPVTDEHQKHLPRPTLDEDARHRQWHAIKVGLMVAMPILAALILVRLCCWTPARVVLVTSPPSKRTRTKEAELTKIGTGTEGRLSEGTFNSLDRSMTRTTMCSSSPSRIDLRGGQQSFDSATSAPRTTTARTTSTSTSSVSTSPSSTDLASLPQHSSSPPLPQHSSASPTTPPPPPPSDLESPPSPPSPQPSLFPPSSPLPQPPRPPGRSSSLLPLSTSELDTSPPAPMRGQRSVQMDKKEGVLWQDGSAGVIFEPKDITALTRHRAGASLDESGANGVN